MDSIQAFFLGFMVACTPSLVILALLLRSSRLSDDDSLSDRLVN